MAESLQDRFLRKVYDLDCLGDDYTIVSPEVFYILQKSGVSMFGFKVILDKGKCPECRQEDCVYYKRRQFKLES